MISSVLTRRELATITAALRLYQEALGDGRRLPADLDPAGALHDIASDCGEWDPLDVNEIEALCASLEPEPTLPSPVGDLSPTLARA